MRFSYSPRGVCSRHFEFDIEENIIKDFSVIGGCMGNLKGIRALIIGMNVDEVINRLEGIDCGGKGTSCPDQISRALKQFKTM